MMIIKRWLSLMFTLTLLLAPVQGALAQPMETRSPDLASKVDSLAGDFDSIAPPADLSDAEWGSMQAQMRLAEYQFTWQTQDGEWAYRAPNRANNLKLAFGYDGLTATRYATGLPGGQPDDQPSGQFGLRLAAYGKQIMPAAISIQGLRWPRA